MFNKYNKYVGILYKTYGRDPAINGGVDCYGLVSYVLRKELNTPVKTYNSVTFEANNLEKTAKNVKRIASDIRDWKDIKDIADVQEGDVLMLRMHGLPVHLGLAINNSKMIHIYQGVNSIIENFRSVKWKNRIWGIKRPVG